MTKELSLFDMLVSGGAKTNQVADTKVTKEGSSLFDDLLKSASNTLSLNLDSQSSSDLTKEGEVSKIVTLEGDKSVNSKVPLSDTQIKINNSQVDVGHNQIITNANTSSIIQDDKTPNQIVSATHLSDNKLNGNEVVDVIKKQDNNSTILTQSVVESVKKDINYEEVVTKSVNDNKDNIQDIVKPRTPSILDALLAKDKQEEVSLVNATLRANVDNTHLDKLELNSNFLTKPTQKSDQINSDSLGENLKANTVVVPNGTNHEDIKSSTISIVPKHNKEVVVASEQLVSTLNISKESPIEKNSNPKQIIQQVVHDTKTLQSDVNIQNLNGASLNKSEQSDQAQIIQNSFNNGTVKELSENNVDTLHQKPVGEFPKSYATDVVSDNNVTKDKIAQKLVSQEELGDESRVLQKPTLNNHEIVHKDTMVVETIKQEDTSQGNKSLNNNVKSDNLQYVKTSIVDDIKVVVSDDREINKPIDGLIRTVVEQQVKPLGGESSVIQETSLSKDQLKSTHNEQKIIPSDSKIKDDLTLVNKPIDEVKSALNTQNSGLTNKHNAALELAKLDTTTPKTVDVQIDTLKHQVNDDGIKQTADTKQESLLDKLIKDSLKISNVDTNRSIDKSNSLESQSINLSNIAKDSTSSNDMVENIYKSTISKNINIAAMQNAQTAKEIAKNGTNLADIEKSAKMLELNLESIQKVVDVSDGESQEQSSMSDGKQKPFNINRAFLEKIDRNLLSNEYKDELESIKQSSNVNDKTITVTSQTKVVDVFVSEAEVLSIQNRIIGARQQLGSMMSSVARAMYENYKPPHTAFRISLNPANLGQIAILIRSQRNEGSLNISMNITNNGTLEAMVANQSELRNSLSKVFDDNHSFELEFKLDQDGSSSNDGTDKNEHQNGEKNQENGSDIAKVVEESEIKSDGTYF